MHAKFGPWGMPWDPSYGHFWVPSHIGFCLFWFFEGLRALGGNPFLFLMKFNVECTQNHVWGPPVARVMSIFVKAYIFGKVELGEAHG